MSSRQLRDPASINELRLPIHLNKNFSPIAFESILNYYISVVFSQGTVMDQVWNESGIIEVIKDIVHKTFDIDLSEKPDTIRVGEIGLDSMGLLDVIMSLEDTIGCKIKNIDLPKDPTLVEVAGMVIRNLPSEIHG